MYYFETNECNAEDEIKPVIPIRESITEYQKTRKKKSKLLSKLTADSKTLNATTKERGKTVDHPIIVRNDTFRNVEKYTANEADHMELRAAIVEDQLKVFKDLKKNFKKDGVARELAVEGPVKRE